MAQGVGLRYLRVGDAGFRLGFSVDREDTAKIYILLHLKKYLYVLETRFFCVAWLS